MVNVTAVRTTGIYCRAGCPAKPLERNTEQYRSQVAAEVNGFRPCLRCRPDREPGLDLDADAPLPLRRALAAISAGALDDGDEAELAAGVGYMGVGLMMTLIFSLTNAILWQIDYGRNPIDDARQDAAAAKLSRKLRD